MRGGGHKNCPSTCGCRQDPQIPKRPLLDLGSHVACPLNPKTDHSPVLHEVGIRFEQRRCQLVTKLWVFDCKGNFHLATCCCDNEFEVNLQPNSSLRDDCFFNSPHPITLEGLCGHSFSGGQRECYTSTHFLAQNLWIGGKVEEVVTKDDYFCCGYMKYALYLGHTWHTKKRVAPVGHRHCFCWHRVRLSTPNFVFCRHGSKLQKKS